jgi:hypothetical protein
MTDHKVGRRAEWLAASDYDTKIIEEFRANKGRIGEPWAGTTLILIHHIGAGAGIEQGVFPK